MRFIHLLVAFSILSALLALPCPSLAATASFKLSPEVVLSKPGEKFEVNLSVTSSANLDAIEIDLAFDPSKLELTKFQPTTTFNAEVRNQIDNQAGSLLWTTVDVQKPRKIITGEVNLGTLTFDGQESGQSAISFKKAQVGSIDTPGITSNQNSVQVIIAGNQSIFEKILTFFRNLF